MPILGSMIKRKGVKIKGKGSKNSENLIAGTRHGLIKRSNKNSQNYLLTGDT